ncbi:LptE family protein [Geotalea sp. SG265]|uniref:LPS assembly lipoprotein LptE n=1 Tax=Geotalea sp. SG265 TaxID=2922867 RepID=UPI001FAF409B|nr:LptE family protein [Geotalea sp. SG265]
MRRLILLFLLFFGVTFSGCGYHHLQGVGSPARGLDGIHVRIFANKSYRAGLETVVTQSLIDEYALHSGGNAVAEGAARLVLSGTVLSYTVDPVSYTAADRVAGYRAALKIAATLTERQTGKIVWKGEVSGNRDFPASPDIALQQNRESAAIAEISRRLAEQLHEKMQEDF